MRIFTFQELKELSLDQLPCIGDLTYFLLNSETLSSLDLKNHLSRLVGNLSLEMKKGPDGKPSFSDSSYRFNLSHSGNLTAVALHPEKEIGIDLETWKPYQRLKPIVERYFLPEEKALLQTLNESDREAMALSIWTVKEAMTKLRGGTLFESLEQICAVPLPKEIELQEELRGSFSLSLAVERDLHVF